MKVPTTKLKKKKKKGQFLKKSEKDSCLKSYQRRRGTVMLQRLEKTEREAMEMAWS